MATQRIQLQKKPVYHRGVVTCPKCAAPIHLYKLTALGDEFSVRCPLAATAAFI